MSKDAIADALRLAKRKKQPVRFHHTIAREGYQDGGVPDEANQQAFLQEQLKGSAPQYVQEADFPSRAAHAVEAADRVAGTVNDLAAKAMYMDTMQSPKGRSAAEIVTAPIPPDPNEVSKQAVQQYQSGDRLGAAETMMGGMPQTGAIRAYHGSPHSFDRFDISKIGTGEGAQAYGHGLYFAESEPVARSYRDALKPGYFNNVLTIDGRDFGSDMGNYYLRKAVEEAVPSPGFGFASGKETFDFYNKEMSDAVYKALLKAETGHDVNSVAANTVDAVLKKNAPYEDESAAVDEIRRALLGHIQNNVTSRPNGSMYEVLINAEPEHLLDWDKPISDQSPVVQKAIYDTYRVKGFTGDKVPLSDIMRQYEQSGLEPNKAAEPYFRSGSHGAYTDLGEQYGSQSAASQKLREAGIPGIKYLDQGSRGAGEGSRNYVIFDDSLIDILRRYADGGAVHDALHLARNKYATDGAVTPQTSAEEPEAQAYGEVSFAPEYTPRPQEEVRRPDEARQEAFIREELKGSAPQYDPSAETGLKNAAIAGAKWTAPGAAADAMGMLGGPSMAENIRQGRYLPAALQAVAVGLPTAMAGRAAINAGLGAGASKFTKLGKPDVFLAPGYVAEQTAEDWAPGVFGKETYEGAKAAGKKALEEGVDYIRRKVGYADGGEVADALRLAKQGGGSADTKTPPKNNYEALQDLLGRPRANTKTYEVPKDHPNYNVSPEEFHKGNLGKGRYALALGGSPFGAAQTAQPAAQPAAQPVAQSAPAQVSAPQQTAYQPNYSSAQTQNQNHNYINSIYQNMFGRQADAGGLNYWANQLSSGTSDPASMISQFAGSNEFQSRYAADPRQAVNSLYQTALGRQADAGGLDYWASQPAGSMDAVGLARQILSSREGQNAQDIQQQYLSNVGRVATPEQLAQAQQSYESGDVGSLNEQISNSPEARQYATNEGIKEAYQAYLGRDADPEGLKHFSDMVNSGKMSLLDAENIIKNSEEGQLYEASNFEPYQVASSDSVTPMPARPKFKTAESARQYIAEELRNMTPEQQRAVLAYAEGNGINTNRPENLAALMWSIQNRANAGFQEGHKDYWAKRNPNSVYDQMLAPAGFTSLTGRTLKHLQAGLNAIDAIKNNEKFQKEYGDIAEGVTSGRIADPTKGAVFYANPHGPGGGSFIRGLEARPKQYSSASGVEGPHRFFYGNQWTEAARKNAPQYQGDASVQQAGYVPPESNLPPQQSINTGPIGGTITNPVGSMYPLGAGGYEPPNQAFQPPPVPVAEPSAPHTPVHNTHAPHAPGPHAPTHHTNSGHGTDSTLHVLSGEGAGQSLSYHVPANHVPYNHIAHPGAGGFNHGHHGSSHHGGPGGHGYWDPNWANSSMHSGGDQSFFKSGGRVKRADGGDVMKDSQIEDALRIARQNGGKTPAWQRAEGKNPAGGLNSKGRASAKAQGHDLKPPAPHPKTEKDAGRRKSFCSRMKGMKAKLTSAETARDPDSRINKSLRAWNCADGGVVDDAVKLAKGGEIWDKERPKGIGKPKKLSESQKSSAKAAAKAAGRPYPNMIDNMNAAKKR